jgi:hypothetical protein
MATVNDDKTFDVDGGVGPCGQLSPKVFSGSGVPTGSAQEGSIYLQANGDQWIYKLSPNGWVKESIGDITQAEGFISNGTEQTTSDGWVSKSGFPWTTIGTKTAGQFSIRWFAQVGQTKTNRNFGFRVLWRPTGGTFEVLGEVQLTVNRDGDVIMQSGFKNVTLPSDNDRRSTWTNYSGAIIYLGKCVHRN